MAKNFLTPIEKKMLNILVDHRDEIVSFQQFVAIIPSCQKHRNLICYVNKLRPKLQGFIVTKKDVGYMYTTRKDKFK